MTFVHSRQWLKFTSVGVESDSIPPAAGVHTAGGGWTLSSHPNPFTAMVRFDERHPEQSPEKSGHLRTPLVDGHPKEAGTECPLPNWTFSVQLPLHIIQSWMTSKTAHKPRMPPARQPPLACLKSAPRAAWWLDGVYPPCGSLLASSLRTGH